MSQRLVNLIDVALERFASRDLIASNELLDVLLDLRIAALDDAALEELLEQESQPTPELRLGDLRARHRIARSVR